MQDLFRRHIESGLAAFEGLTLTGTIPITQDALNDLIREALKGATQPAAHEPRRSAAGLAPDLPRLLPLIRKIEVTAETGRLIVSFEVRV